MPENRASVADSREADRGDPVRFFPVGCIVQQGAHFDPSTLYVSRAPGKVTTFFRQFSTITDFRIFVLFGLTGTAWLYLSMRCTPGNSRKIEVFRQFPTAAAVLQLAGCSMVSSVIIMAERAIPDGRPGDRAAIRSDQGAPVRGDCPRAGTSWEQRCRSSATPPRRAPRESPMMQYTTPGGVVYYINREICPPHP